MFKGKGSVVGLQSSGYQLAMAKVTGYENLLKHLKPPEKYEANIKQARDAFENRIWRLIPFPKNDAAWALLLQLRHILCLELPLEYLLGSIAVDIRDDIDFLQREEARVARSKLKGVEEGIESVLKTANEVQERVLRTQLLALSKRSAEARAARWLKVNMTRTRLLLMGGLLFLLLPLVAFILPDVIGDETTTFYFMILLFGAFGGLISALLSPEPLGGFITFFYIRRRLLYLRPLIGATLALVAYFAVRSRLISVVGIDQDSGSEPFLVLAFITGFAERPFVQRLLKIATPEEEGESEGSAINGETDDQEPAVPKRADQMPKVVAKHGAQGKHA